MTISHKSIMSRDINPSHDLSISVANYMRVPGSHMHAHTPPGLWLKWHVVSEALDCVRTATPTHLWYLKNL